MSLTLTERNKLIQIPANLLNAVDRGIIVQKSLQYCRAPKGMLILPEGQDQGMEKKYDVAEVISIGAAVNRDEVAVGDIVLWQKSTGFRIPNGTDDAVLFKCEYTAMSIITVLPNLVADKRSDRWKGEVLKQRLGITEEELEVQLAPVRAEYENLLAVER